MCFRCSFAVINGANNYNYNTSAVPASSNGGSDQALIVSISVILAILVVICAMIQLILYKGRRRRRRRMDADNMIIINDAAQREIELRNEDDDESNLVISGEEDKERGFSVDDTVNNGIISNYNSISSDLANKFGIELREENDVELGEIELVSSHMNPDENKQNRKEWDMTTLGD